MIVSVLTTEALTVGKSLSELRPHVHVEMFAELYLDLSCFHTAIDHVLNALGIYGVEHITDPFLVNVDPVTWIRQIRKHIVSALGIFQEICDGEAFNLWDCCDLDVFSLDILNFIHKLFVINLPPFFQT